MSDSNYTYLEAAARRKKKNQIISILIIIAVVLVGVAIWGVREHQNNEAAERIKNALNSQVEPPAFATDTANAKTPVETTQVVATSEPVVKPEPPVVEKPAVAPPKPKPAKVAKAAKPKPEPIAPPEMETPKPVTKVPAVKPIPEVKPEPVAKVEPKPEPVVKVEPKPEPVKPVESPKPAVVTPPPTPPVVEKPVTPAPQKSFEPEDLPVPKKPEASAETQLAMNTMPKTADVETSAEPASSDVFKQGLAAYKQNDYANATRLFGQLPVPASKKRGERDRDEFVQGNFFRGVALLRTNHTSEAVGAFQNVLAYEKFYPMANMNLGICYVDLKQYAKAHRAFDAVVRDQNYIEPAIFDDVMQRTKYFWALAWTRLYKSSENPDRQAYYRQQAILRWKDYQVWFGKNDKYRAENQKADDYLKSLSQP